MSEQSARWRDLGTRVLSAVVLVAITLAALWSGPVAWDIFVFAVFGLMIYELARLCDPEISFARRVALGVVPLAYPMLAIAGIVLGDDRLIEDLPPGITGQGLFEGGIYGAVMGVAAPLIVGLVMLGRGRLLWLAYGALLCGAVLYLAYDYNQHGAGGILAIVGLVVVSDSAGYFAGRAFGGPKFWPAISPKKTWSGTVAGWIGCAIFGAVVLPHFGLTWLEGAVASFVVCFAAQMGDIAESAMKRRVGLKDSSSLIPGHGGVLDRLDALVAAACLAGIITLVSGG